MNWSIGHNSWLFVTFSGFLTSVIFFSILYWLLYQRNRNNFNFNADVLTGRVKQFQAESADTLHRLNCAIALLELTLRPSAKAGAIEEHEKGVKWLDPESGMRWELSVFTTGTGMGASVAYCMDFFDAHGTALKREEVSYKEWKTPVLACTRVLNKLQRAKLGIEKRLATVGSHMSPDVWSFWDFVYFSTITQTTVGYGDILPNSTLIRLIVVVQIFIGYALLVVVLNLALGRA